MICGGRYDAYQHLGKKQNWNNRYSALSWKISYLKEAAHTFYSNHSNSRWSIDIKSIWEAMLVTLVFQKLATKL